MSDPQYAGQLTTKDGKRLFFDDPGCLIHEAERIGAQTEALWVRMSSGAWIDARRAKYRNGAMTPMNYGFVADAGGALDFNAVRKALLGSKAP